MDALLFQEPPRNTVGHVPFQRTRPQGSIVRVFFSVYANRMETDLSTVAPSIVQKAYELALWLIPKAGKFGRAHRFTIGDRLVNHSIDLVETLAAAAYAASSQRAALLDRANQRINGLRYVLRLAKDLHLLNVESYGHGAELLEEVGRMLGGWRRSGK